MTLSLLNVDPQHLREFFAYVAAARKWALVDPELASEPDIRCLLAAFPQSSGEVLGEQEARKRAGEALRQSEAMAKACAEELTKALDALDESEKKLRWATEATEAAELAIWSWDVAQDSVIWENDRPYEFFGIDRAQGPVNAARFVAEFLHREDAPGFESAAANALRTGERFFFLGRFYRKSGELRWIEFTGHPTPGVGGKFIHMFGTAADVTARQSQQLAVEESEARLRRVFESNVVGMIKWNLDRSLILDANEEFLRMTGYTREDVAEGRLNFRALTPPEWTPLNEDGIRRIREQGFAAPYEKEYFRKDGSRVPVIIAGTRFDDAPSEGMSFLIDITERKRAEAAMRQNAALFSTLIEQAPVGVYVVDAQFRLQQVNTVALPAFRSVRPLLGRDFGEVMDILWGPEVGGELAAVFRHTLETGERYISPPFSEQRQDLGEEHAYEWETQRVTLPDGQHGVVCYFSDVTERHRAAAALQEAKDAAEAANRSKDRFLAVLSHELRTPLTPVLMTAAAHRMDEDLPREIRDEFGMIERNIALEARLIEDLLDLTRIVNGKLTVRAEPCDAHSLLGLVVEMVRSDALEKQITIQLELAAQRRHLTGDPARLQQVLWNLLRNAVKFTPAGGRVCVRSFDSADATGLENQSRLCIEVIDNGIGFEPAAAARIFEPFEQSGAGQSFGGLGLGLAIARAVVELHRGAIHAESPGPGQGATFTVELPGEINSRVGAATRGHDSDDAPERDTPFRLLLVEDHEPTLQVLTRLLVRAGHQVLTARSLAEAHATAAKETVNLVISDLGLPDGTGIELMHHLRATYGLRGIALTGYGASDDLRRSEDAGFVAHLVKPVNIHELRRVLRSLSATNS